MSRGLVDGPAGREPRRVRRRAIVVAVGLMTVGMLIVLRAAEPAPVEATSLPSHVADAAGSTVLTKTARVLGSTIPKTRPSTEPAPSQAAARESVGLATLSRRDAMPSASEPPTQVASAETVALSHSEASEVVTLVVPKSVRVLGPLAFSIDGTRYKLQSADGLGVSACGSKRSGRCFRRPRGDLKRAIAGATLRCRQAERAERGDLLACTKDQG